MFYPDSEFLLVPPGGQVLDALALSGSVVTKRRIRGGEAGFKEQVVCCLVAESVGVLAPSPEVWVLNRLSRELRLECLGSRQD